MRGQERNKKKELNYYKDIHGKHGKVKSGGKKVVINLSHTKYPVLHTVADKLGYKVSNDDKLVGRKDWDVAWIDSGQNLAPLVRSMQPYQMVNHIPGMSTIYHKDKLAITMKKMAAFLPEHYSYTPKTWLLPQEHSQVVAHLLNGGTGGIATGSRRPHSPRSPSACSPRRPSSGSFSTRHSNLPYVPCVIMKPATSAQGKGIYLATSPHHLPSPPTPSYTSSQNPTLHNPLLNPPSLSYIAQEYISHPYLIDNYKFDLRIYVLVTCIHPLRMYIYEEGLVRVCTHPYTPPTSGNMGDVFMHLTNYSINKYNDKYVQNQGGSDSEYGYGYTNDSSHDQKASQSSSNPSPPPSKLPLQWLRTYIAQRGGDWNKLWDEIGGLGVKTVVSCVPQLQKHVFDCKLSGLNKNPFTCFELLGLDILLTSSLSPVLLEVNHLPSLSTPSPLDETIKSNLLKDTLQLLHPHPNHRIRVEQGIKEESWERLVGGSNRSSKGSNKDESNSSPRSRGFDLESYFFNSYIQNEAKCVKGKGGKGGWELIYPNPSMPKFSLYAYLHYCAEVIGEGVGGGVFGAARSGGEKEEEWIYTVKANLPSYQTFCEVFGHPVYVDKGSGCDEGGVVTEKARALHTKERNALPFIPKPCMEPSITFSAPDVNNHMWGVGYGGEMDGDGSEEYPLATLPYPAAPIIHKPLPPAPRQQEVSLNDGHGQDLDGTITVGKSRASRALHHFRTSTTNTSSSSEASAIEAAEAEAVGWHSMHGGGGGSSIDSEDRREEEEATGSPLFFSASSDTSPVQMDNGKSATKMMGLTEYLQNANHNGLSRGSDEGKRDCRGELFSVSSDDEDPDCIVLPTLLPCGPQSAQTQHISPAVTPSSPSRSYINPVHASPFCVEDVSSVYLAYKQQYLDAYRKAKASVGLRGEM